MTLGENRRFRHTVGCCGGCRLFPAPRPRDGDPRYVDHQTRDPVAGGVTAAIGVLVPNGIDPAANGQRPVVLYVHGTTLTHVENMADVSHDDEVLLVMAMYVAQGFIVVTPNHARDMGRRVPHWLRSAEGRCRSERIGAASRIVGVSVRNALACGLFKEVFGVGNLMRWWTAKALLLHRCLQIPQAVSATHIAEAANISFGRRAPACPVRAAPAKA